MSQPLLANWRITLPCTVDGLTHKLRVYVKSTGALVSGVVQIINRTGATQDWSDFADSLIDTVGAYYATAASVGPASLESLSGTIWNLQAQDTHTPAAQSGTNQHGWQVTQIVRDTAFKQVKIVVLEGNQGGLQHATAITSSPGVIQNFQSFWVTAGAGQNAFDWAVSRGNRYMLPGGFVGYTVTTNRKIRRRRGLS